MIAVAKPKSSARAERNRARVIAEYERLTKQLGEPPAMKVLAQRVGLARGTVRKHLVSSGVSRPTRPRGVTRAKVVAAHKRLEKELGRQPFLREIADVTGISADTVRGHLANAVRAGEVVRSFRRVVAMEASAPSRAVEAKAPQNPSCPIDESKRLYWSAWRRMRMGREGRDKARVMTIADYLARTGRTLTRGQSLDLSRRAAVIWSSQGGANRRRPGGAYMFPVRVLDAAIERLEATA